MPHPTSWRESSYRNAIDIARGLSVMRLLALSALAVSVVIAGVTLANARVPLVPTLVALLWLGVLALAGRTWLQLVRIHCRGVEALACSLALALTAHTLGTALLTATTRAWTWVLVLAIVLSALPQIAQARRVWPPRLDALGTALATMVAVIVTIEAAAGYFSAFVVRSDGTGLVQLWPVDWDFHLALTSEVRRQFPPELPFFAGKPMNYHYFIDLLIVGLADVTGARLIDAVAIIEPFAAWLVLLAATLALLARMTRSDRVAIAGAVGLAFVGGTFTIFPGLLYLGSTKVWEHAFHAQPTLAYYTINPSGIAIALLLCGLLFISRWLDGDGLRHALIGGGLLGVATAFKVFAGLTVFGGLGIAALVTLVRHRDGRLVPPLVGGAAVAVPLSLPYALRNAGAGQLELTLQPAYFTAWSLDFQGFTDAARTVDEAARGVTTEPWAVLLTVVLTLLVLAAGAGYRLLILPRLWRDLGAGDRSRALWTVLAWSAVVGTVVMLLFRLLPRDFPQAYNNLGFSYHVGLVFAGFYAAKALVDWHAAGRRALVMLIGTAWMLGAISLGQFFVAQAARGATVLPEAEVDALAYVRERTPSDALFIVPVRPSSGGYPWVERLGERRVVLGADWSTLHVPRSEIDARARDVARLLDSPATNGDALVRLGADYVFLTPAEADEAWRPLIASGITETVFEAGGFRILRVDRRNGG